MKNQLIYNTKEEEETLIESQISDENCYSVFYKYGDEANDYLLSKKEALELAANLEDEGYEVIVVNMNS